MAEQSTLRKDDAQYRREIVGHSFRGALFSAISGASFFGMLGGLLRIAMNGVEAPGSGAIFNLLTSAGISTTPPVVALGILAVAGAIGITATYMAQQEFTEIKMLQDEHLAQKNAECREQVQAQSKDPKSCDVEYAQNTRQDNRQWQQVVSQSSDLMKSEDRAIH